MKKIWFDEAWEDYTYWQTQDKKTLRRLIWALVMLSYIIKKSGETCLQCHMH